MFAQMRHRGHDVGRTCTKPSSAPVCHRWQDYRATYRVAGRHSRWSGVQRSIGDAPSVLQTMPCDKCLMI